MPNADDIFYLSIKNKQILSVQLIKNEVYDLIGLNAKWQLTHKYFEAIPRLISLQNRNQDKIYCTPESNFGPDGSGCTSYFSFNLMSSGQIFVRKRAYQTLTQTLGTIGGVSGILSMVFTFVYSSINEKRKAQYILRKVYPLIVAEKHINTKKVTFLAPVAITIIRKAVLAVDD